MPKLTEVYEELQGRPASKVAIDLEKRQSIVVSFGGSLTLASLNAIILTYEGETLTQDGSILYRS